MELGSLCKNKRLKVITFGVLVMGLFSIDRGVTNA